MSLFFPQLARAAVAGAAMETGRQAVRRNNGLGFAAGGDYDGGDYYYDDILDGYWDDWGNLWYYTNGGGGGGYDFQSYLLDYPDPGPGYITDPNSPFNQAFGYYKDPYTFAIDTAAPFKPPGSDNFNWDEYWNWAKGILEPWVIPPLGGGPGPALYDPSGSQQPLPGYCPKGTYHPQNDPYACVPFPPGDPSAKKRADQQRKAMQAAASAARKAQQQQDKQCPKDPQGRKVWRNPQTGKCELVPPCPQQGQKFDPTTRRCLTPEQAKELYGSNNWLLWLLIAAGVIVIASNRGGGGSGGRKR